MEAILQDPDEAVLRDTKNNKKSENVVRYMNKEQCPILQEM